MAMVVLNPLSQHSRQIFPLFPSPLAIGGSLPNTMFLGHPRDLYSKRDLDPSSHFCRAQASDRLTDTTCHGNTDHNSLNLLLLLTKWMLTVSLCAGSRTQTRPVQSADWRSQAASMETNRNWRHQSQVRRYGDTLQVIHSSLSAPSQMETGWLTCLASPHWTFYTATASASQFLNSTNRTTLP